ncbi:MAG: YlxR family protein [Chloroflexi bacterium]|nr:YlxR family protein [Chloroflexota bacterium]
MPRAGAGPRPRHVPRRTCVACREGLAKRELVRVVRTPAGGVLVDPSGKLSGRGAYVHRDAACWTGALQRQSLARALHMETISDADLSALRAFAASLAAADAGR